MKFRIQSIRMACLALFCAAFASCNDDALIEASQKYAGKFELTVTQGNPESRLELGQDGLTTQWEPGDKLVLVDKTRTLAPIFLNCTLKEKSTTATFVAESGVPAGNYYVIYNYNENLAYSHKRFQSINSVNMNDDLVLWNELNIQEGDENASISLQHLYAKVSVVLQNVPADASGFQIGMYSSKKGFPANKLFTNNGLVDAEYGINPNSMSYSYTDTYFPSNRKFHNIRFGNYNSDYKYDETTGMGGQDWSKANELSALVLPADLSDEDVYFYVLHGQQCYEFKKSGVNFKGGTSYKVVLDMSQAKVSSFTYASNNTQIKEAVDWRHAAYRNENYAIYELAQDIDFKDEAFFPIVASRLYGGNHTLSNINLDWIDEDNVGLSRIESENFSEIIPKCASLMNYVTSISDLTLENVTIKGNNYVGAFGGWNVEATNCKVIGSSIIEGKGNYVGGIVGINKFEDTNNASAKLVDVRIGQACSVRGKNYVGGIVGRCVSSNHYGDIYNCSSLMILESCTSEGTVTASEDYVGGIFGKMGGSLYNSNNGSINFAMEDYTFSLVKCINEGIVTGRHYVGGIGGGFNIYSNNGSASTLDRIVLSQSCSSGNVTGNSNVGGILGSSSVATNICYSTGAVTASTSIVGGIVGSITGGQSSRVANCYSMATLSADDNTKTGGIVGNAGMSTVTNCYYAADPNTYSFGGIVGYSGGGMSVTNCLTTLNSLGTNLGDHEEFGPKRENVDYDNDGDADYDYDNNGVTDIYDLYEWYTNYKDNITNSITAVASILANKDIINGDNAYSSNYWDINLYPWYCLKFSSFSGMTGAPGFDSETIQ